jgi:ceramide synthetase
MLDKIKEHVHHVAVQVPEGPLLNRVLTLIFLANSAYSFVALLGTDTVAFLQFLVLMPVTYVGSQMIYAFMSRIASWMNENIFTHGTNIRAFDDKRRLSKFCDQGWQLVLHIIASSLEYPTLHAEGLLTDVSGCWRPCPVDQTCPPLMRLAYMFELAAYTFSGIQHRFFSVKKKDYYVMFGHHITTCVLVLFSYLTKCYRIGLIVMFIHDSSDIVVDLTQMCNHANMEGAQYFFITEIFFVAMISAWFFTRIWYLSWMVIRSIIFDSHKLCALKFPGQPWKYPKCEGVPFYRGGATLLTVLWFMQVYWFYLSVLILIKVIRNEGTNKGKVYETDLDEVEAQKAKAKVKPKEQE